jgi:replication factor A1
MIKIPLSDIINKIKEKSGISEAEINAKIDKKLDQLSGLISKEGAAHIIANELGIKLFEQSAGRLQIKNILAGMRNVETVGKVQRLFELREFQTENRTGKVASLIIADETGSIRIVMWGDQADRVSQIKENDILKIIGGYVRENQGRKEIHINDRSKLALNPPGEKIDSVKEFTSRRRSIADLGESEENAELLGTIVQVFDPRFFPVCPSCGKRTKDESNQHTCLDHGQVNPNHSYVLNLILDDGTETIRCVFFKNQVERLLNKTENEMQQFKDNADGFSPVKNELLGKIVKLIGRVSKNQMFDRLEFIAQLVFPDPNPQDEVQRLEAEKAENAS